MEALLSRPVFIKDVEHLWDHENRRKFKGAEKQEVGIPHGDSMNNGVEAGLGCQTCEYKTVQNIYNVSTLNSRHHTPKTLVNS